MQNMPAADGIPCHHGDHRFRTGADHALKFQHVQPVDSLIVLIAGIPAHALIAAGAKRLFALAGQNDHADVEIIAGVLQRRFHLFHRQGPERVAHFRPVDGDFGNAFRLVILDVGKLAGFNPIDGAHVFPLLLF